jgi:hypothetical protein
MSHFTVHYLDDVRHAAAIMWTYGAWAGNISAGVIVAAFASMFYPPVRKRLEAFIKSHNDLHDKLDHIIKHHPDIPDFIPKEKS